MTQEHRDKIISELTNLPLYEIKWVKDYQPNEIEYIFSLMERQTGKHGWLLECNSTKTKFRKISYAV